MTRQRDAANLVAIRIFDVIIEIMIKTIVTEPPPAPIISRWRPFPATSIALETAMIIIGVFGFIVAHLAVRADPRERVSVSSLSRSLPIPCSSSSILKSRPGSECSAYEACALFILRYLTSFLFGGQWRSSPPSLAIATSLKSTTSQRVRRLINECFGSLCTFIDVDVTAPCSDEISAAIYYEGGINFLGVAS